MLHGLRLWAVEGVSGVRRRVAPSQSRIAGSVGKRKSCPKERYFYRRSPVKEEIPASSRCSWICSSINGAFQAYRPVNNTLGGEQQGQPQSNQDSREGLHLHFLLVVLLLRHRLLCSQQLTRLCRFANKNNVEARSTSSID